MQGRSEVGARGQKVPGLESLGRQKVPTMSQVLSSMQYTYSQMTLGSNTGAPNLLLA